MTPGDVHVYFDPIVPSATLRLSALLEDDEIGLWASEASVKYRVSALEVLGALAQALALDQHRGPVSQKAPPEATESHLV
jgi:hypothetical protein